MMLPKEPNPSLSVILQDESGETNHLITENQMRSVSTGPPLLDVLVTLTFNRC